MLVSVKQLKKETNQPIDPEKKKSKILSAEEAAIAPEEKPIIKTITKGNILGSGVNLEKRKEMISAKGFEPAEFAYERAIGKNDSLYSNFTELIALTKRKIGRIVIVEDNPTQHGFAESYSPEGQQ